MSSSFTRGDGDGPRPTPPPSGEPQLPTDPAGLLVEPGRAGTDICAPLDDLHLWSDAALAVVRTEFADARRRANAWTPKPCPLLAAAVDRLTQMERAT